MFTLKKLGQLLETESSLSIKLPSGDFVPPHFHVTEVGLVRKTFIDCGGTRRETAACVLQVWTAHDVDHRLLSTKLAKILKLAKPILGDDDLLVEVEYGSEYVSQYPVADVQIKEGGLVLTLGSKHTECLAPDKCGVIECCQGGKCC
jgi:hypothetical protein